MGREGRSSPEYWMHSSCPGYTRQQQCVRTAMTSLFGFSRGKDRTCLLSRQEVKSHKAPVRGHWTPKPAPEPTVSIRGLRVLELVFAYLVLKMELSGIVCLYRKCWIWKTSSFQVFCFIRNLNPSILLYVHGILSAYMYVCAMCMLGAMGPLEVELQTVVNHHMGAENWTRDL